MSVEALCDLLRYECILFDYIATQLLHSSRHLTANDLASLYVQLDPETPNFCTICNWILSTTLNSCCIEGVWREVSVGGGIYGLRESRSAPTKGRPIPSETSELIDGTLIDICGATLLWRSSAGLARSPTNR